MLNICQLSFFSYIYTLNATLDKNSIKMWDAHIKVTGNHTVMLEEFVVGNRTYCNNVCLLMLLYSKGHNKL